MANIKVLRWIGAALFVGSVIFLTAWLSSIQLAWLTPIVIILLAVVARVYVSSRKSREIRRNQNVSKGWDPKAYGEQMKKSTDYVSALFLIDSPEDVDKCAQWLAVLQPYGMPSMVGSAYFEDVRAIHAASKQVINFDFDLSLRWGEKDFRAFLRCQSFLPQGHEIELILPGVIANEISDHFGDGYERFMCAFLPPAFYD